MHRPQKGDRARARTSSIPVGRFALKNSFCLVSFFSARVYSTSEKKGGGDVMRVGDF